MTLRIKVVAVGLLALIANTAIAGVLYSWRADCLDRTLSIGTASTPLGCSGPLRGFVTMPDGYVPGSSYDSPFSTITFLIFDDIFINDYAEYLVQASITMPATSGTPLWNMSNSAMLSRASLDGFIFGTELRLTNPVEGFKVQGENITAQLVSEPASVVLISTGLLAMLLLRRAVGLQSSRRRRECS
jgi:hypothetical protein